jgi:L-2-hydroxyglutarate oxidase LhgO
MRLAGEQAERRSMEPEFDIVVVGAGVVGLAVGRALARAGREVLVLEKNAAIGEETSSRNSEVIHAGIYYPRGSLKAALCVRGRDALYRYCAEKHIPHERLGKVIVAVSDAQRAELELLKITADANGVQDLRWLDDDALHQLEPAVRGVAALLSPSTGIVDSHALMLALLGDLEQAGGQLALRSRLTEGTVDGGLLRLTIETDDETLELRARGLVNAAGLHADRVARALPALASVPIPRLRYAKGNYFIFRGTSPFRHLLYPLPEPGGLGVHATLDLAGRTRFGPDVEWSEEIDYTLDPARAKRFYDAIRRYWPSLPDGTLSPGYVGVRPKLTGPGEAPADFAITVGETAGGGKIAHLFGIESPGLTAALAIGEHVLQRLAD